MPNLLRLPLEIILLIGSKLPSDDLLQFRASSTALYTTLTPLVFQNLQIIEPTCDKHDLNQPFNQQGDHCRNNHPQHYHSVEYCGHNDNNSRDYSNIQIKLRTTSSICEFANKLVAGRYSMTWVRTLWISCDPFRPKRILASGAHGITTRTGSAGFRSAKDAITWLLSVPISESRNSINEFNINIYYGNCREKLLNKRVYQANLPLVVAARHLLESDITDLTAPISTTDGMVKGPTVNVNLSEPISLYLPVSIPLKNVSISISNAFMDENFQFWPELEVLTLNAVPEDTEYTCENLAPILKKSRLRKLIIKGALTLRAEDDEDEVALELELEQQQEQEQDSEDDEDGGEGDNRIIGNGIIEDHSDAEKDIDWIPDTLEYLELEDFYGESSKMITKPLVQQLKIHGDPTWLFKYYKFPNLNQLTMGGFYSMGHVDSDLDELYRVFQYSHHISDLELIGYSFLGVKTLMQKYPSLRQSIHSLKMNGVHRVFSDETPTSIPFGRHTTAFYLADLNLVAPNVEIHVDKRLGKLIKSFEKQLVAECPSWSNYKIISSPSSSSSSSDD